MTMISQGPEDIEITSRFGPLRPLMDARWEGSTAQNDPDCVKTPRGITAPGILGSMVMRRTKKNAKICLPLGITTKSDFVFTRPRPEAAVSPIEISQRNKSPRQSAMLSPWPVAADAIWST
jgi:hypothetical protein